MKVAPLVAAPLVAAVLATLAQAGCVTRTVYVVDDRDDAPVPASARATASAEPPPRYEDDAGIHRVEDFYEPLSPYGRWVHTPAYGMVFIPSGAVVGAGFRPYTHGHWEQTEWGWTWVDHHPFGWATGHYGRWYFDASYGWVWVPGTAWAPAWVSWRTGGGYVGWAPMPPGAVFGGVYTVYETSWVFVSYSSMGVGYVGNALIVGPGYRTCYGSTSPYRDTYVVYGRTYYRGPREDDVVRAGGHVVHRPIRDVDSDRAVTRPPSASSRDREDADGRTRSRGDRDDGTRSDRSSGSPRGRDDDRSDDRSGNDDASGAPRGRDDRGGSDDRGSSDDRGRPVDLVDDRGAIVNDATPRIDPAAGLVGERGEVGVGVSEPDGVGVGRGGREPVGGERDRTPPGSVRDNPELGTPWRDDQRPTKGHPENPERFKPITDPFGDRGAPIPHRGPAVDRPSVDPRGPATGGRPGNLERAPRVQPDRSTPPTTIAPQPGQPGAPTAEQPAQGKKDGKKGKTTKSTKKVEARPRP